ncbi:MAG: alginate O-acetyltransferase AlgX-related protein, partial [Spirochaetota bacterium]
LAIDTTASSGGAQLVVLLVPASVEVCGPKDLRYLSRATHPQYDTTTYDLNQPRDLSLQILESEGIDWLDLRPVLRATEQCPYWSMNMHWNEHGHRLVAEAVADYIEGMEPRP